MEVFSSPAGASVDSAYAFTALLGAAPAILRIYGSYQSVSLVQQGADDMEDVMASAREASKEVIEVGTGTLLSLMQDVCTGMKFAFGSLAFASRMMTTMVIEKNHCVRTM